MSMPPGNQPVSFAQHIKPLFRSTDRESMTFAFDLWDVEDVRANADAILRELQGGSMPCDSDWEPENIELLRRWIATGKLE